MSIAGRENFEYVTMGTYSADMAELSTLAGNVATVQRISIEERDRMIWLLVEACGGLVKIPRSALDRYRRKEATLTIEKMLEDDSVVVSTR